MIELPYPAKILWPNGRGHFMKKHREFAKHKEWAYHAGLAADVHRANWPLRVSWSATFYPKTRNVVDRDNAAASLKSYQDGLAAAMAIDDNRFDNPTIHFAEPVRNGKVVIVIGEGEKPALSPGNLVGDSATGGA